MRNKSFFTIFIFVVTIVSFSSCSSSQRFTVRGTPGTMIATQDGQTTMIDQSGQVTLTMDRTIGSYSHFLLSKSPNSNIWVPFAIDYKDHNRGFTKAVAITAGAISIAGSIGCAAMAIGGVEGTAILIPGAAAFAGAGLAVPLGIKSEYTFDYIQQSTNNDLIR